ncbi:MAG TPA: dTDP-4-dehydrorhamnose 3,5-epimerase [Nitrospirales bacterium]|nr:dTDP-4-dehydrorhamnose 3,5-epimerase [Nitrospirales bacterium]
MHFTATDLPGVFLIEPEPAVDDRGMFARTWCRQEFSEHGLDANWVQSSVSFNPHRGTVRGLHYQAPPNPETKLIRCTRGAIFDVVVDLRPGSPTLGRHIAIELNANTHRELYVPDGLAHGFQTLEDDTEVIYLISEYYHPELSRGVRWNDPAFGIAWPLPVSKISERDRTYPDWSAELVGKGT